MADLGLPGSVVECRRGPQKACGRCAGRPNIMMSLKGDGNLQLIEDCAVPLRTWPTTPTR